MDYDSLTLLELKTMCKDRGLKVSGNKAEVVIRLMEDDESKEPQSVSNPATASQFWTAANVWATDVWWAASTNLHHK